MENVKKQQSLKEVKNKPDNKFSIYEEFVIWYSMPAIGKRELGIENQKQFSDFYKVSQVTLSHWKNKPDFRPRVRQLRDEWAFEKTQHVIEAVYKSAVKGNDKSQKLWLQFFEGFTEKTENTEIKKVEFGVNDIRFLIEVLPEPLKTKHYDNLRELLDDIQSIRNARSIEDDRWNERPDRTVSDETDSDALILPEPGDGKHAMAKRNSDSVSTNLERKVSENNHKGTSWRGEIKTTWNYWI